MFDRQWLLSLFEIINIFFFQLVKVLLLWWDLLHNVLGIKIFFAILLYSHFLFFNELFIDFDLVFLLLKSSFPDALKNNLTLILNSLDAFLYQNYSFQRNFLQSPRFLFDKTLELLLKIFETFQTISNFGRHILLWSINKNLSLFLHFLCASLEEIWHLIYYYFSLAFLMMYGLKISLLNVALLRNHAIWYDSFDLILFFL